MSADIIMNIKPSTVVLNEEIALASIVNPTILNHNDSMVSNKLTKKLDNQYDLVTVNISGCRFETRLCTFEKFPETLLGDKRKRKEFWNQERKEYFFDRHRACFECILHYYQSDGHLRRPSAIPLDTFLEEIAFFQLGSIAYAQVKKSEDICEIKTKRMPKIRWRKFIWRLLECPESSIWARLINILTISITLLCCFVLALQTLPTYANKWINICLEQGNLSLNSTLVPPCSAMFNSPFFIIQSICAAYFTIEFLLRLISTPSYKNFVCSISTWIDLTAFIPYFVDLGILLNATYLNINMDASVHITILRVLRLLRILKLFQIFKQWKSLSALGIALKETIIEFVGAVCGLVILAFLFGAAAFVAEHDDNPVMFDSIPKATYWGLITITTVGYGDIYPITVVGRVIAILCALSGASVIGMLVSVLVDRYQHVFSQKMYSHDEQSLFTDKNDELGDEKNNITKELCNNKQLIDGQPAKQTLTFNHEKYFDQESTLQSSLKSKFNLFISFNDTTIDDSLAHQIITSLTGRLLELQQTIKKDIHFEITDHNGHTFTSSGTHKLSVSDPADM